MFFSFKLSFNHIFMVKQISFFVGSMKKSGIQKEGRDMRFKRTGFAIFLTFFSFFSVCMLESYINQRARAQQKDKVTVLSVDWNEDESIVTVIATSNAAQPSLRLTAEVMAGNDVLRAREMVYYRHENKYLAEFLDIRTQPDAVVVKSSLGGTEEVPIDYKAAVEPATEPETEEAPAVQPSKEFKSDEVTITKAQWQPRKKRKWRVIVIATSNAPPDSVKLFAKVKAGDITLKAGPMKFRKNTKDYSAVFVNVRNTPDKAIVTSSGGGSDEEPISRFAEEPGD
jgi:hypothetical protein